jgi:tetratricopeptide (TPR) repeat protein
MRRGFEDEAALPTAAPRALGCRPRDSVGGRLRLILCAALLALSCALAPPPAAAQASGQTLYGDLKVDESKVSGMKPLSYDIILYGRNRTVLARQSVPNNGRFRFLNLDSGQYELAVEVGNVEIMRVVVELFSPFKTDFRHDIELEWRANPAEEKRQRSGDVSAKDFYKRTPANQGRFDKAEEALNGKKYEEAAAALRQLVADDPKDFPAWAELGTACLFQNNAAEAEKAYLRALEVKPDFALAHLDLARLRMAQKNYDGAIEILTKAVALQPPSADANFLLGECYLQIKKGSKAVPYLEEAARLGRPDAHLRLATLYDRAGLKDRAAAEYELFLAAKPDYPDRKKLEQYIKENKKQ